MASRTTPRPGSPAHLEQRVAELEEQLRARKIELKQLPLTALKRKLTSELTPDADTFLLPKSVGSDSLEDGAVGTSELAVLPQARIYRSTGAGGQSLTSSTWTQIDMDSTEYDLGAPSTQVDLANNQLICKVAGLYLIQSVLQFNNTATGTRLSVTNVNGGFPASSANVLGEAGGEAPSSTQPMFVQTQRLARLAVNDVVDVWGWQSTGGALDCNPGDESMALEWVWLSS